MVCEISNFLDVIKSKEYKDELNTMAERIISSSKRAPNEATIESNFDCELFTFFRQQFSKFGFEYNPIKEKPVDTVRTVLEYSKI